MPAKPSCQIKTSVIKKPQKNGDTYILERRTIYDPEKKYTKVLSTKLIAKIPKGSEIPVPTRPKRGKNSIPDTKTQIVTAKRNHIGMMDIIGHIGSTYLGHAVRAVVAVFLLGVSVIGKSPFRSAAF